MSNEALKFSIAAGVVHAISAVAALVFFLILKFNAAGMIKIPVLVILAVFIAIFAFVGLVIFVIQIFCAVGIIVMGILQKRKLCATFCGISLLADLVAAFFGAVFGFAFLSDGATGAVLFIAIDLLLLSALSIAGIVLSIIAMVKNLSKKSACEDNCK